MRKSVFAGAFATALLFFVQPFTASAEILQQGSKLVGTGGVTSAMQQGISVAISGDGNTAISGGPGDNSDQGAAWVFVRANGNWTQQTRLVPSNPLSATTKFGRSVGLSFDGNVAVIGGPDDGIVWVFRRTAGTWDAGTKLGAATGSQGTSVAVSADGNTVIAGAPQVQSALVYAYDAQQDQWSSAQVLNPTLGVVGGPSFGTAVSLSPDGNTALVGGPDNDSSNGAAWVFVRSGGTWSEQAVLIGTGNVGAARQGSGVALSADGNTALVGGPFDGNTTTGAAWAWTRSGTQWTQQTKLLPSEFLFGSADFGFAVGLSSDGNTAVIGAPNQRAQDGAAWVFTRSQGTWTEQGGTLNASGAGNGAQEGYGVAISADGNTLLTGGPSDDGSTGAVWVYAQTPSVTSVSPAAGPTAGGNTVTITGSGFTGVDTTGSFAVAGNAVTATVVDPTHITFTAPAHAAGAVSIDIDNGISLTTAVDAYTYFALPQVTNVLPISGTADGGNSVAVVGSNLSGATSVKFGGTEVTSFTIVNDGEVDVITPMHAPGSVAVAVTTPGGTGTLNGGFIFVARPAVTGLSPNKGDIDGGTSVVITGTDFDFGGTVTFGGTDATSFTVDSTTQITAVAPAHAVGQVHVVVSTQGGFSATSAASRFTYLDDPIVTAVSPANGPSAGNTTVTITGTHLTGATAVNFGGSAGTNLVVHSATSLTVKTPAHAAGAVAVAVTTPNGTGSKAHAFTYIAAPTVTAINPNQGPAAGGTSVAIVGTNLTGATGVKFGATAATSFSVSNATHATATAPPHAEGVAYVTITTPGGTSAAAAGNRFTYTKTPVLTTIAKFAGGTRDGAKPVGGLVADATGALYGTTSQGGKSGLGTIFKLTPSGNTYTKTILHHFDGLTGATPFAGLVIDRNKSLYGVTTAGGNKNKGVIFKLVGTTYTVLYNFQGTAADGGVPYATLARDGIGVLYGATTTGGSKGKGTTFTFKEPGTFKLTHHFTGGADGDNPQGAILLDASKNVYGTTIEGGRPNAGTAYKIAPNGTRTILHTFGARGDGKEPRGGLFMKGTTLFGTSSTGGTQDKGTVFEITPPSVADTVLFNFTGATGANPYAGVVGDGANILYSTTFNGGAHSLGTVFKLIPPANGQAAWSESVMYSFRGGRNEGASPAAPVLLGKNRTLYGTTNGGGSTACAGGCGTVFKVEY